MRILKNFFIIAAMALATTACTQEDGPIPAPEEQKPQQELQSLSRSESEAIQQAITDRKNMLGIATPASRGNLEVRYVMGKNKSRGANADTLLYVVNFPDEEGYAVIPKNKNLGTLAVTESGSFSSIDEMENPTAQCFLSVAKEYTLSGIGYDVIGGSNTLPPIPMQYIGRDTTNYVRSATKIPYKWGPDGVLAKYCPNHATGCVPLACAMTLAYFEQPASMTLTYPSRDRNSISFDWTSIRKHIKENNVQGNCWCGGSMDAHDQIAYMCRQLGELIGSVYSTGWQTSGTYTGALSALKSIMPSRSIVLKDYSSAVTADIRNGILLMFGKSEDGGAYSNHCWICDGYYWLRYEEIAYNVDPVTKKKTYDHSLGFTNHEYMHVNWGFDGADNGYYKRDIFDASTGYRYLDDSNDGHIQKPHKYPVSEIKYIFVKF